jgi:hypothetical protein
MIRPCGVLANCNKKNKNAVSSRPERQEKSHLTFVVGKNIFLEFEPASSSDHQFWHQKKKKKGYSLFERNQAPSSLPIFHYMTLLCKISLEVLNCRRKRRRRSGPVSRKLTGKTKVRVNMSSSHLFHERFFLFDVRLGQASGPHRRFTRKKTDRPFGEERDCLGVLPSASERGPEKKNKDEFFPRAGCRGLSQYFAKIPWLSVITFP